MLTRFKEWYGNRESVRIRRGWKKISFRTFDVGYMKIRIDVKGGGSFFKEYVGRIRDRGIVFGVSINSAKGMFESELKSGVFDFKDIRVPFSIIPLTSIHTITIIEDRSSIVEHQCDCTEDTGWYPGWKPYPMYDDGREVEISRFWLTPEGEVVDNSW